MDQTGIFGRSAIQHFVVVAMILLPVCLFAGRADSLRNAIIQSRNEPARLHAMSLLAIELMPDSMGRAGELLQEAAPLVEKGNANQVAGYHNATGLYYWFTGNRQQAIASFKNTLAIPEHHSIMNARAMAANNAGTLFRMLGEIDSAKVYLQKALEIDIGRGYMHGIAKTNYDLAILYDRSSQYHIALRYILNAVSFQDEAADTMALIYSYNVMGNVYSRLDSSAKANYYYGKGMEMAEKAGRDSQTISYLNNLMSLNAGMPDSIAKTLSYFQHGLLLATQYDDYRNLLALHGNMARAYAAANEPEMATSFFRMGLNYFEQADDLGVKARFLYHYGNHLFRNDKIDLAGDNLHQALHFARLSGEVSTQMLIYRTLASIDSINGNHKAAMQHLQNSFSIRDSLYTVKKSAVIAEIQLLHDIHQYEKQLAEISNESRFNRLRYIYSIVIGLTGIGLLVIGVLYFRKRKLIAEKNLLISEAEHSKLQIQYEANRRELTGKAMALLNSERLIKTLQENMKVFVDQADEGCRHKLQPVIRMLNTEDKSKELWKDFENRFNELSDGFISKLTEKHPELSPAEIRLCAMLRLQMPSKEISQISQRSLRTIEQSRFKIRKKIGLKPGDNLVSYLLNI
jgi:tetratricopeptide (TPR) repeat protein/DNA-binding CsgD family transcriptional regulator